MELHEHGNAAPRKRHLRARLRRANQRLRGQVAHYRRTTLLAAGAALVLAVVLGFTTLGDDPDAVPLGQGRAGVMTPDTAAVAASAPEAAEPVPEAAERPAGEGEASYYHDGLTGNPTASGEPYDPTRLTAAHRTLPLGSELRVTNVRTGTSVVVEVTDRGPFHGNRVVDLSRAAARRLGMLQSGVARVRLTLIE